MGAPAVHTQDIITQKETFGVSPDTLYSRYIIQRLMKVKDNKHHSLELSTFSKKKRNAYKNMAGNKFVVHRGINLRG